LSRKRKVPAMLKKGKMTGHHKQISVSAQKLESLKKLMRMRLFKSKSQNVKTAKKRAKKVIVKKDVKIHKKDIIIKELRQKLKLKASTKKLKPLKKKLSKKSKGKNGLSAVDPYILAHYTTPPPTKHVVQERKRKLEKMLFDRNPPDMARAPHESKTYNHKQVFKEAYNKRVMGRYLKWEHAQEMDKKAASGTADAFVDYLNKYTKRWEKVDKVQAVDKSVPDKAAN